MLERRFKVRVQHCFAAGLALFMPLACGKALLDPDQAGGQCVPGMQIQCACPGALVGVQACQADKTFAECQCEGSGVAGNSSASNAGNAGAQASAGDGSTQGGEFGVAGQGNCLVIDDSVSVPAHHGINSERELWVIRVSIC